MDNKDVDFEWRDHVPEWYGNPLPDDVSESIADLQRAVIDVINKAQALGIVCIVTNAVRGWVEKTTKKWLPKLNQYILGHGTRPQILVLYGQQEYQRPKPESQAASLGWVDDLGELMWWKKAAMSAVLCRIDDVYRVAGTGIDSGVGSSSVCSGDQQGCPSDAGEALKEVTWLADSNAKDLVNLISIGDSEAEMQSSPGRTAAFCGGPEPWFGHMQWTFQESFQRTPCAAAATPALGEGVEVV